MSETIEKIEGIGFSALGQTVWITCECGNVGWANFSKYIRDTFKWVKEENKAARKIRDKSIHVICGKCQRTISIEEFQKKQVEWKEKHDLTK